MSKDSILGELKDEVDQIDFNVPSKFNIIAE